LSNTWPKISLFHGILGIVLCSYYFNIFRCYWRILLWAALSHLQGSVLEACRVPHCDSLPWPYLLYLLHLGGSSCATPQSYFDMLTLNVEFSRLRFYPIPAPRISSFGTRGAVAHFLSPTCALCWHSGYAFLYHSLSSASSSGSENRYVL